jgi:phage gp36-like protein
VKRRYDDAMKFLDDVAKGIRTIGVDGAGASIAPSAGNVEFNTSRRVFGGDEDGAREFG